MKKLLSVSKWCALALVAGVIAGSPGEALAVGNNIAGFGINASGQSDALVGLASIMGVLIKMFTFFSIVMLDLFGELMGTEMLTGSEAQSAMLPMWVWVRNLANVGFVVALVALAFTNLFASFSGGEGEWTIKKKLPKIIIAMIAVNFSMLGFRLVIDAINVGTIAILGIADTKLEGTDSQQLNGLMGQHEWVQVDEASTFVTQGGAIQYTPKTMLGKSEEEKVKDGRDCSHVWDVESKPDVTELQNESKVLYYKKEGNDEEMQHFVCLSTAEQINRMFCKSHDDIYRNNLLASKDATGKEAIRTQVAEDPDCLMMLDMEKYGGAGASTRKPGTPTELNLFMAFGTVFMHLENLPALGANLDKLGSVIDNTLFSGILSLAFLAALIAVFVALLIRVIVLWVAIVFSPLLVGASILGFGNAGGGKISEMVITHLIMPLKIAAAFAISFVMVSSMIQFGIGSDDGGTFFFGPALAQMGTDEYALLWQVATIVIFWKAAFWALEGNAAAFITDSIKSGAEVLATTTAKTVTVDRQLFTVPGDKSGASFSLSNVLDMPGIIQQHANAEKLKGRTALKSMLGMGDAGSEAAVGKLSEKIRDSHQNSVDTWNTVGVDANRLNVNFDDAIGNKDFRAAMVSKNPSLIKNTFNLDNAEDFMTMSNSDVSEGIRKWIKSDAIGETKDLKAWMAGTATKNDAADTGKDGKSDAAEQGTKVDQDNQKIMMTTDGGNSASKDVSKKGLKNADDKYLKGANISASDFEYIQGMKDWKGVKPADIASLLMAAGAESVVLKEATDDKDGLQLKNNNGALQVELMQHGENGNSPVNLGKFGGDIAGHVDDLGEVFTKLITEMGNSGTNTEKLTEVITETKISDVTVTPPKETEKEDK